MAIASFGAPARHRASVVIAAAILALAALVAVPALVPAAASAEAAAGRPLAVIVVGPVEGMTSAYVLDARRIAAQLKSYGADVREIFSTSATSSQETEASRGANLFVYLGHYVRRSLRLAPGAVVILNHVPYAAGSSEPGRAYPTRPTAARRADNYAAGFLGSGAAVVFASDRSVAAIVRDLFGTERTMRSVFWRSPSASTWYASAFTSSRTAGASGILAPYSPGQYYESVVGRLQLTTTDWRRTWDLPVRVTSIPALLTALANDSVTEIVVANGTYGVSGAVDKAATSLWIGSRFAGRTRPVLVRAETTGGVTFDGRGADYFGGISFQEGAHDQTWQGFVFTHGSPVESGVIMFGGYPGSPGAHNITLLDITVDHVGTPGAPRGHAVYFSESVGGVHDILIDGLTVSDPLGGIKAALHFYHSDAANRNAWNVTVRRLQVSGTDQAIVVWDPTLRNITVDTATITNALRVAVRYESAGASGITFANITSTGSGSGTGFYSSLGTAPAGVTFVNNSLR